LPLPCGAFFAMQFSRATSSSSNEECNLDLSGRFVDGVVPLPKLINVSTQTSTTHVETPAVNDTVDRATSTEGRNTNVRLF